MRTLVLIYGRLVASVLGYVALFAALLLGPARTWNWPAGWALLGVLFVTRAVSTIALHRENPGLLRERTRVPLHRDQAGLDRILLPAFMASFAAQVAFVSFDRWRLHLLPAPAVWVRWLGITAFVFGWYVVHLALRANSFAVTVVRHQPERGHEVVTAGPYSVVRHPMYAGLVPVTIGLGFWLGSSAGAIAGLVPVALLAIRIVVEERFLRQALPAYVNYAEAVRWRLVPGVW
jgi:protein-S-isoprenylcysteine O-methyltransferase Ste14